MIKLIGLSGAAGSGKDVAAQALIEQGWTRVAFADKMRDALLALDPVVDANITLGGNFWGLVRLSELIAELGWDEAKRNYSEVRRLLEKFGTEAGRDIHGEDCWVRAALNFWDWEKPLVLTDARFDNEARAIRERGGYVIRIVRPDLEELPGGNDAHPSRRGLSPHLVDWNIYNDGTIEDLHRLVLDAVERLGRMKA